MIDIDIEEIKKIKDPNIRFVVDQLRMNGLIAATHDDTVSRKISKRLPEFREKEIILMAPDRRTNMNIISVNPALINPNKEVERFIKKMIQIF